MSQAANLYADVTGRISSITTQLVQSEETHQYGVGAPIDRDHMREMGLFIQDQWRVTPTLTVNLGFRLEKQFAFVNEDGLYSEVNYQSLWGISGVGNLFAPGSSSGVHPSFNQITGQDELDLSIAPRSWTPFLWQRRQSGREEDTGRLADLGRSAHPVRHAPLFRIGWRTLAVFAVPLPRQWLFAIKFWWPGTLASCAMPYGCVFVV